MTSVVNLRNDRYDVYIGRPSKWGNPFSVKFYGRSKALRLYIHYLKRHPEIVEAARRELTGKVLGCYCKPLTCHGDILIAFMEKV